MTSRSLIVYESSTDNLPGWREFVSVVSGQPCVDLNLATWHPQLHAARTVAEISYNHTKLFSRSREHIDVEQECNNTASPTRPAMLPQPVRASSVAELPQCCCQVIRIAATPVGPFISGWTAPRAVSARISKCSFSPMLLFLSRPSHAVG